MLLNLLVVDRTTHKVKVVTSSTNWELTDDKLSAATSSFMLQHDVDSTDILAGDFLIAKVEAEKFFPTVIDTAGYAHALYYGVVDSYSEKKLTTRQIMGVANVDCIAYTGNNPATYLTNLWNRWVARPGSKLENFSISTSGLRVSGWTITFDKPTKSNVLTLLTDIFKSNQIVLDCVGYTFNDTTGVVTFHISAWQDKVANTNWVIPADNTSQVNNYDPYIQPANVGIPNACRVQDISKAEGTYTDYYLHKNGAVNTTLDSTVAQPVSSTAYLYNAASLSKPKPSMLDLAKQQLKTRDYQHEITMSYSLENGYPDKAVSLGHYIKIRYQGKTLQSVLTSFALTSDSNWATLSCGNIRTKLAVVLDS